MGKAPVRIRARALGRNLLLCVALLVWFLPLGPGAAPQDCNPPEVQTRENQNEGVNPSLQLRVARSLETASGDESAEVGKTFVDMPPAELIKAVPELKHLEPAESPDLLPQILKGVGATVAAFFDNFSNTTCTERVISKLDTPLTTSALHYDNTYNYVALAQPGPLKCRLQEYRTDAKGEPVKLDAKSGVLTFGFVTLAVHFHRDFQADSRFRYLGREEVEKQNTYVVAFAQRPEVARQTASIKFGDRAGIIFMQGVAWIDPLSFRILRLRTDIEQPEVNVGLQKETIQVLYSEVSFTEDGKTLWLPREVYVTGQVGKLNFHNQHRYSDYRLFKVQVDQKHDNP
ncbi:MAG: hypothetical protein ABSF45_02560 [Terriglobia bacterium]|jgi:hypothetical protein